MALWAVMLAMGVGTAHAATVSVPPEQLDRERLAQSVREFADTVRQRASTLTKELKPGAPAAPTLSNEEVLAIAADDARVTDWIADHPVARTTPEFKAGEGKHIVWYVRTTPEGKEVTEAQVWVLDETGAITEVRTGPQVAWMMARGYEGSFGRAITRPVIWIPLGLMFLIPLLRLRSLISWRTLDLLALLSFSVSLWWFNRGEIYTSVPLAYPPMVYLTVRMAAIGLTRMRRAGVAPAPTVDPAPPDSPDAAPPRRPRFLGWAPTWLLVTVLLVCLALRYGLNAFDSNVIDVGYAGPIGADRIAHGITPYGTFPSDCGQCDTYGPLAYLTYIPFELFQPWTGKWDGLPAAHGAAVMFDLMCIAGLAFIGWRLGGRRLAAALALAWAAFPFTAYSLASNSNDSLVAAAMIGAVAVAAHPVLRGLGMGLAVATKFGPAIIVPLLMRAPFPRPRANDRGRRGALRYIGGLLLAGISVGWVLLLDGDDGVRAFWSRTIAYQFGRESPFSIWGQYPALRPVQLALTAVVALAALAVLRWPRRLDMRSSCALAAALLLGTQLTLTHWFYLYIPWFLPFVLIAVVPHWPGGEPAPAPPTPLAADEPDVEDPAPEDSADMVTIVRPAT